VAHRMLDLPMPSRINRHPTGHRPQLQVSLELGPLGRCPRPLPRAPTLKEGTILGLIMAFWGTLCDTLVSGTLLDAAKIVG
jgi:hypothetical protein